jgi:hypothetical protein
MGIDDDVDYESNDDAYGEEDDGQPSEQQEWEDYEGQDPCTEQW